MYLLVNYSHVPVAKLKGVSLLCLIIIQSIVSIKAQSQEYVKYVPTLLNLEALIQQEYKELYENEEAAPNQNTSIEPQYAYVYQGKYLFNKAIFSYAEPFHNCGLAEVRFINDTFRSIINSKGKVLFKTSGYLAILDKGYIVFEQSESKDQRSKAETYGIADSLGNILIQNIPQKPHWVRDANVFYFDNEAGKKCLINLQGHIIANNLYENVYDYENRTAFFINEKVKKGSSAFELINAEGKVLYTSPYVKHPLEKNVEEYRDYFPRKVKIRKDQNGTIIYNFIVSDYKNFNKNVFMQLNDKGGVLHERKGAFNFFKDDGDVVTLENTELDDDDPLKYQIYHRKTGKHIIPIASYTSRSKQHYFYLYAHKNNGVTLLYEKGEISIPLPAFNRVEINRHYTFQNVVSFLKITAYRLHKNKETIHVYFWDFNRGQLISVPTDNHHIGYGKLLYFDDSGTFMVRTPKNQSIPVKLESFDAKTPLDKIKFGPSTPYFFSIHYQDSLYLYSYEGKRINTVLFDDIETLYEASEYNGTKNTDVYYTLDTETRKITVLGFPQKKYKRISENVSNMGNILAQDEHDSIWILPYYPSASSEVLLPIFLTRDSFFKYQFSSLAFSDFYSNVEFRKIPFPDNIDFIFNDDQNIFWMIYDNNVRFQRTYQGPFIKNVIKNLGWVCESSNFENYEITKLKHLIYTHKNWGYIPRLDANNSLVLDSFNFNPYNQATSIKILPACEYIQNGYTELENTADLNHLVWVVVDSIQTGIFNLNTLTWLIDPYHQKMVKWYGHQNYTNNTSFVLFVVETKDTLHLKNISGDIILELPLGAEISIFDEGSEMGTFLIQRYQGKETTYRINSEYRVRKNDPNQEILKSKFSSVPINLELEYSDNYNVSSEFFKAQLELEGITLTLYYDRDGKLYFE